MSSLPARPPFIQPASFVHLTPLNLEAREAFNDVALLAKKSVERITQGPKLQHPAKFMFIEPYCAQAPSPLSDTGIEILEPNTSFGSSPLPEPEELQYQGFYDLSFDNLSDIPRNGWVAGVGRWNPDGHAFTTTGAVDLMLAPRPSKK